MHRVAAHHRVSHLLFVGIVTGFYATAIALAGLLPDLERPECGRCRHGYRYDRPRSAGILSPGGASSPVADRDTDPGHCAQRAAASQVIPPDHRQPIRVFEVLAVLL